MFNFISREEAERTFEIFQTQINYLVKRVNNYEKRIRQLEKKEQELMAILDDLKVSVEAAVGAETSAVVLINGIVDELKVALANNTNDPAVIADLIAKLDAATAPLAAAVAANPLTVPPVV